jgi:IS4 transposase
MVANTNPDQGTNLAYKFVTICIVDPDVRFTLDCVIIEDGGTDELAAAGRKLVSTAREYVTLKHVYCDREMYRVRLVKTFDELDVDLVMRAPTNRGVQRLIEEHDTDTFITEYEMRRSNPPTCRVNVRLIVVPHRTREDDHFCLVTTRELDADAVEFAEPLAEAYRRRWGIETSYRKVGEFLPKTTSPTFSVRLFYFLFAVALYNLWVLVNLLLAPQHTRERTQTIPTAIFREFLGVVPYG